MTNIINAINDSIARLSETNFEEMSATSLQLGLTSIRNAIHELVKVRNHIDNVIADKVIADEVDEDFDATVEMSYENMTGLVTKARKAFDELCFVTKTNLPGLIAAIGGYQTMNTFTTFVCKCAEQNIGTFDKSRLEAMLSSCN